MAKGYLSRYSIILRKLKTNAYCSFAELENYIEQEVDHLRMVDDRIEVGFCKRTLQRDIKDIRDNFGIDIEYSRAHKGYFINHTDRANQSFQRMMEAFDVFNTLNLTKNYTPFIHFEQRQPQGTNNLQGIMHAIQNRLKVSFKYRKFWNEEMTDRVVSPYALKEFRDRWYLLAMDDKVEKIKSFALDRISAFQITQKKFVASEAFDADRYYQPFFGIISPENVKPQPIILSFKAFQGKYIKSLPLHQSQEIIVDNDDELQIGLNMCITHDFVMELLSYGSNLRVICPLSLVEEVKNAHKAAYETYL